MRNVDAYPVPKDWARNAKFNASTYESAYQRSLEDPQAFWLQQAARLDWQKIPVRADESCFRKQGFQVRWFADGVLNVSANCLDRHLEQFGDSTALVWEPDDPEAPSRSLSYRELHTLVCRFANVLRAQDVKKGDRVTIYLPMIPEVAVAMLACARIGAIHSVVFGGFSAEALADRITDCGSRIVITADVGRRGGKSVTLKANVDIACDLTSLVEKVIVVATASGSVTMRRGRDVDYASEMTTASAECPAELMSAEDPLFILYTSGSTGKPKGVVHSSGGYLLWASLTHEITFDYSPGQVFWCTADVGWVTGHTYGIYGPLANGGTTLMFEGVPNWPDASRIWQVVDRHRVEILYTAPTALRALMKEGDQFVTRTSRCSLRLLGTVGEPINAETWRWYHKVVGAARCPIVDTWWQTETGGHMITPLPGATTLKPGSAAKPFLGVVPQLIGNDGTILEGAVSGNLVIGRSWPGQMRGLWGDPERFYSAYFSQFEGLYSTGDGARRDEDGYYWITGRLDDVINVSGHRLGTAEVESALVFHAKVAEAAVVGFPHDVKGQGIYAYVTLNSGEVETDLLRRELVQLVRSEIGPIATPDAIQFAQRLPKTRSGKIMRRILRKIAEGELAGLGDTSTLTDPSVIADLVTKRIC